MWIKKHVPTSLSIFSNLKEGTSFQWNTDPQHLGPSFVGEREDMASQSKAQMKFLFVFETNIKIKLGSILENLSQRHDWREQTRRRKMSQDDNESYKCACIQFSQIQKNHFLALQEPLER